LGEEVIESLMRKQVLSLLSLSIHIVRQWWNMAHWKREKSRSCDQQDNRKKENLMKSYLTQVFGVWVKARKNSSYHDRHRHLQQHHFQIQEEAETRDEGMTALNCGR
jgi:hypothetical protein